MENVAIALFNDELLINKRSFSIDQDANKTLEFSVAKTANFKGKIQITYNDIFLFDNSFFFNISSRSKTNILSIGKTSNALSRIFSEESFNFSNSLLQNVNYNSIAEQQLIILNELQNIPNVLQTTLIQFLENGGHLLIIPHQLVEVCPYYSFFK